MRPPYQDILEWPGIGQADYNWLIIIVLAVALLGLVLYISRIRRKQREQHWTMIHAFARRRRVGSKAIKYLKDFYNTLSRSEADQVVFHASFFRSRLYEYLSHDKRVPPEEQVQLLDRLFPDQKATMAVRSMHDLHSGEVCSLEVRGEHRLGTILEVGETMLTISVEEERPQGAMPEAELYVYRLNEGGFLLPGQVVETWKGGLRFAPKGDVERRGEQHLMSMLEGPIELRPWGPEAKKDAEKPPETQGEITSVMIRGQVERVSDRALTFFAEDHDLPQYLKQHNVWSGSVSLPGGFTLKCEGRVVRIKQTRYLFKYLNLPTKERERLFQLIKKNSPQREVLV